MKSLGIGCADDFKNIAVRRYLNHSLFTIRFSPKSFAFKRGSRPLYCSGCAVFPAPPFCKSVIFSVFQKAEFAGGHASFTASAALCFRHRRFANL